MYVKWKELHPMCITMYQVELALQPCNTLFVIEDFMRDHPSVVPGIVPQEEPCSYS